MATEQDVLAHVESIASSLSATQEALADCLDVAVARRNASHRDPSLPHPALRAVSEVVLLLEMTRERLLDVVKTIPAKAEYAPFAARLREMASKHAEVEAVIRQAPRELAAPLSDSVPVLMQIAADLLQGRDRLLEAGSGLRLVTSGASAPDAAVEPPPPAPPGAVHVATPIVLPAQLDPSALQALNQVAAVVPSLAEAVRQLGELSSGLRRTGEQIAPLAPAVAATPKADDWERTLAPLREMSFVAPALQAVLERMEALEGKLSAQTVKPSDGSAAGALGPEAEAVAASLRGVHDVAGPLVDSLSDLAHLTAPLAEKLRALAAAPMPAAAPAAAAEPPAPAVKPSAASTDGLAEWANDILRAVKDLKSAIAHAPRAEGEGERRLWESVRRLQTEIVNLQGALLSPPKKPLPEDHHL
jgi:hypothetical protein